MITESILHIMQNYHPPWKIACEVILPSRIINRTAFKERRELGMILNIWLNLNNVNILGCHVPNYYRFSGSDMFVILWFPWDRSSDIN